MIELATLASAMPARPRQGASLQSSSLKTSSGGDSRVGTRFRRAWGQFQDTAFGDFGGRNRRGQPRQARVAAGLTFRREYRPLSEEERARSTRRATLELTRTRTAADLTDAMAPARQLMLERALAALDLELKALEG